MSPAESVTERVVGYFPGSLGRITQLHAAYYHEHWSFDVSFEVDVAGALAEFMGRFRDGRDGLWTALVGEVFAGSIAIDGALADSDGARLRWFIVDPQFQGRRLGRRLMSDAVEFCRHAGYSKVFLWTFKGLDTARHLYERCGFILVEQHASARWGPSIEEQKFELVLR
jgi:GNAT superfamily N-acetyltransferase